MSSICSSETSIHFCRATHRYILGDISFQILFPLSINMIMRYKLVLKPQNLFYVREFCVDCFGGGGGKSYVLPSRPSTPTD
jgi:hypothetical protein